MTILLNICMTLHDPACQKCLVCRFLISKEILSCFQLLHKSMTVMSIRHMSYEATMLYLSAIFQASPQILFLLQIGLTIRGQRTLYLVVIKQNTMLCTKNTLDMTLLQPFSLKPRIFWNQTINFNELYSRALQFRCWRVQRERCYGQRCSDEMSNPKSGGWPSVSLQLAGLSRKWVYLLQNNSW